MSDKIREQYKAFSRWCCDSRQRGLDPRLHQHAGPIEHGGYIADPKTATAFAAWQAALAQQPAAEQPDTVKVPRELADRLCHRDNYTRQMARRELRNILLGKEGEA